MRIIEQQTTLKLNTLHNNGCDFSPEKKRKTLFAAFRKHGETPEMNEVIQAQPLGHFG